MKIYVRGMIMMMNVIRKDDLHVKTLIIMKTNVKRVRLLVMKAKATMMTVLVHDQSCDSLEERRQAGRQRP